jgi:hypothetical protein
MYHPSNYMPRQSAPLTAASVFGPILGELPDSVTEWMELSEPVKIVRVSPDIMFHSTKRKQGPNDMRGDTGTYQRVAKSARDTLSNPYALKRSKKPRRFFIIGRVESFGSRYPSIEYIRLVLKYVPSEQAHSGKPEMWFETYTWHSQQKIKSYLTGARILT